MGDHGVYGLWDVWYNVHGFLDMDHVAFIEKKSEKQVVALILQLRCNSLFRLSFLHFGKEKTNGER